jgi:hypothetical protein
MDMQKLNNQSFSQGMYGRQDLQTLIKKMSTVAFMLTVDGKAFVEDIVGGADQPQYLKILKWRLFELLSEIDFLLSGYEMSDPIHYGAMSLEYGLREILPLNTAEIVDVFQFNEKFENDQVNLDNVFNIWERIIAQFPGKLPEAMLQEGQDELLLAIKNWSRIYARADLNTDYLKKLLDEI